MATAKKTKKTVPADFMIDEGTPKKQMEPNFDFLKDVPSKVVPSGMVDEEVQVVDISQLDDPDCGLARMYYEFMMYGKPVTQEMKDIMDDPEKLKEFQLTHEFNVEGE